MSTKTHSSVATVTPPRSAFTRRESYTPKLTPSFDSSSGSPTSEASGSHSGYTGYTGSTLTTHKSLQQKVAPSRRRKREDEQILRGAALIRQSLVPSRPQRGIDPPPQRSLFDDDEEDDDEDDDEEVEDEERQEEDEEGEETLGALEEEDSYIIRGEEDSYIIRGEEDSHIIREEEEDSGVTREEEGSGITRGEEDSYIIREEDNSDILREGVDSDVFHEEEDSNACQDDFSDPWSCEKRQESKTMEVDEATSSLPSSLPSTLLRDDDYSMQNSSIDGDLHWATMAILPKESVESRNSDKPLFSESWDPPEIPAPPSYPHPDDATNGTDGTHITHMGRGKSLRVKMVTYHVMPLQDMMDDTTCGSYDGTLESLQMIAPEPEPEPKKKILTPTRKLSLSRSRKKEVVIPEVKQRFAPLSPLSPPPRPPPPISPLSSPMSVEFEDLQRDQAYRHAQDAGYVWQSLVGQHVRFPKHWFDGARGPPVGSTENPWQYIARHTVPGNPIFTRFVRNRTVPGRILLHLMVRDLMTGVSVFDLAIGIFHPNARGVRQTKRPEPFNEGSHHVWMAIRKRTNDVSLMDNVLCRGQRIEDIAKESPLGGHRRSVTNQNMRAVFGEEPPAFTICIQESELYEKLTAAAERHRASASAPALLILQEFLIMA